MLKRTALLLLGLIVVWTATVQAAPIEDHHFDAALFIVPTANQVRPAQPVGSVAEYEAVYGRFAGVDYGALAASQFFANGGQRLYVIDPGGTTVSDFEQALADSIGLPVSLVALPGAGCCIGNPAVFRSVMQALMQHVARSPNRFALIDAPENSSASELLAYRAGFSGTHAALYAPWLVVDDPTASSGRRAVPPSAAIAGVIARIDRSKGIFKSPAGPDAGLSGSLNPALERDLAAMSGSLNNHSVNVLRQFAVTGQFPVIWGARVLDTGVAPYVARYRYRRHVRYSIRTSLRQHFDSMGAGLAPNVIVIEEMIDVYMHAQWMRGAIVGSTPQQAWFTRCTLLAVKLECRIGFSFLRPAEFDIVRVQLITDRIFQSGFE